MAGSSNHMERSEAGARWQLALVALLVAALLFNIWSLMRFPPPFMDEAWLAARAWSFNQTHRPFGPLDAGVLERFEGYWTFLPWLPTFLQSVILRPFSEPALFPLRWLSLAFGLLLLAAIYYIGLRISGRELGLLSILLVIVSWPFLYSSHLARVDIFSAALGFAAIALSLREEPQEIWPGLASGLCLGLAFEIHAHAAVYGPAILALMFVNYRWAVLRTRSFWAFLSGTTVSLVVYTLLHVAPYPGTYVALGELAFQATHTPPILELEPRIWVQGFLDLGRLLGTAYLVSIPILVWSILMLTRRSTKGDRLLLVLGASLFGAGALLIRTKLFYYAILFSPCLDMIMAVFLLDFVQRTWSRTVQDYLKQALVWGVVAGGIMLNVSLVCRDYQQYYRAAQTRVNQSVRSDDSVMATQTYWFGLYRNVYYSWEQLIYYQRYLPGSTLEEALREFHPDIFIVDGHMAGLMSDGTGDSSYFDHLRLPKSEMERLLDQYGKLLDEFQVEYYGKFRVYRLDWDRAGR